MWKEGAGALFYMAVHDDRSTRYVKYCDLAFICFGIRDYTGGVRASFVTDGLAKTFYLSSCVMPFAGQLVFCDKDPGRAKELGTQYVKEYFATVAEHYDIGGEHFKHTKGYEYYGNAADAIEAMGLETMAEIYAGVNTFGTPEQIVEQLRNQKEILGVDHDVLVIAKYGSMSQEEAESSIALIANEVIPKLK